MSQDSTQPVGVDRPSNVAIARWIATQAAGRSDFSDDAGNYERACMEEAVKALEADPPRLSDALNEAEEGVAHAWRGRYQEDRFEAWACAAVSALLRDA